MMKKCNNCKKTKSLDDFYFHKKTADNRGTVCKDCAKAKAAARRAENKKNPDWVIKEKMRLRDKYHRLKGHEGEATYRIRRERSKVLHFKKFPEKKKSRVLTRRAVRRKELVRSKGSNLHHWSYKEEDHMSVIEMTVEEHRLLHQHSYYDQDEMMYRRNDNDELIDSKEKCEAFLKEILDNVGKDNNGG